MLLWYLQTGSWIIYSYQGEGFNFNDPNVFNFLWSYSGGLFVYAPIFLLSLLGVFRYLLRKEYYLFLTWSGFFAVVVYVLSSWWTWKYGMSYGMRVMIEFYPLLFIPMAILLSNESWRIAIPIAAIGLPTIPVSVIQTYQYKKYILHWSEMSKSDYWKVFLHTEPQFNALLWEEKHIEGKRLLAEFNIGDFEIEKNRSEDVKTYLMKDIPSFSNINCVEVLVDDNFNTDDNSKIIVHINDGEEVIYWQDKYLLHFQEEGFNKKHTGKANFNFTPLGKRNSDTATVSIGLYAKNKTKKFENITVRFYSNL